APLMSAPAVTGWRAGTAQTVTVDLTRTTTIRTATAWFVDAASYGVIRPTNITVATSTDGTTWTTLGTTTTASRSWYSSHGYTTTGAPRQARYLKVTIAANTTNPTAWHMISEVEAAAN
ncbi:MAG TPA: discoidin domain-containing protein, partial [Pseudonocardiaceae bacterium]